MHLIGNNDDIGIRYIPVLEIETLMDGDVLTQHN